MVGTRQFSYVPLSFNATLLQDLNFGRQSIIRNEDSPTKAVANEFEIHSSFCMSSVIPSESHDSHFQKINIGMGTSRSLKLKSTNINKMQNFNELIGSKKTPNITMSKELEIYLTKLGGKIHHPSQIKGRFVMVNHLMWNQFKTWFNPDYEIKLSMIS